MAYLGTPPRSRVLSSADIATGAVTLDDISFTDQPASMNISGNIDKHTMRLADQVVVNGDLDVTDNLILSKISDDGNAIILTNDSSTRTIEGAGGSLEASTLTQTPNASLTGMTGTVGSGVTIGSAVDLGSATFPAGMVIQNKIVATHTGSSNIASNSGNYDTVISGTCTPKLASTGSYLKFTFFSNQIHLQSGVTGVVTMTLRQSSASDTYAAGDCMHNTPAQPRVWLESNVASNRFSTFSFFSGTDSDSTAHVSNISSWSAGETLYWNLFQYRAGGSANIMLHLANGRLQIQLEEITI